MRAYEINTFLGLSAMLLIWLDILIIFISIKRKISWHNLDDFDDPWPAVAQARYNLRNLENNKRKVKRQILKSIKILVPCGSGLEWTVPILLVVVIRGYLGIKDFLHAMLNKLAKVINNIIDKKLSYRKPLHTTKFRRILVLPWQ